jgi:glutamate synthase domain-containing protein 2
MTSTVGVEAQLAGAHVLTVEMSVITPDVPYSRYGIAEAVSSLDELEEKIAIGERCGSGGIKPVGQATQKIADLVQAAIEAAGPVATNARQ